MEVHARDQGRCQAEQLWPEVCCGGRIDPHHIDPTGMGYPRVCLPDRLISLCRNHHDQTHQVDPIRARQLGLLT